MNDCLHCQLHAVIQQWILHHPQSGDDEVFSAIHQVIRDYSLIPQVIFGIDWHPGTEAIN